MGSASRRVCIWGVFLQWGLPTRERVFLRRMRLQGGFCISPSSPESEKRAVRILLKCCLAFIKFASHSILIVLSFFDMGMICIYVKQCHHLRQGAVIISGSCGLIFYLCSNRCSKTSVFKVVKIANIIIAHHHFKCVLY